MNLFYLPFSLNESSFYSSKCNPKVAHFLFIATETSFSRTHMLLLEFLSHITTKRLNNSNSKLNPIGTEKKPTASSVYSRITQTWIDSKSDGMDGPGARVLNRTTRYVLMYGIVKKAFCSVHTRGGGSIGNGEFPRNVQSHWPNRSSVIRLKLRTTR